VKIERQSTRILRVDETVVQTTQLQDVTVSNLVNSPPAPALAVRPPLWENTLMIRWFFFLLTIAIGAAAGLYYGWVINPIRYVDAAPAVLRADYKADYVLMTAEAYRADGDMELALERLALLGGASPAESVALATVFAVKAGYGEADLALMQSLADAIHGAGPLQEPLPESPSP
jgi:hypothetical protein